VRPLLSGACAARVARVDSSAQSRWRCPVQANEPSAAEGCPLHQSPDGSHPIVCHGAVGHSHIPSWWRSSSAYAKRLPEKVLVGTDCGFATSVVLDVGHLDVARAKREALPGSMVASKPLWGKVGT
jgi:hypothetical protein